MDDQDGEVLWHALVEHAPDVIMSLDPEGRIRFLNRPLPGVVCEVGSLWLDFMAPAEREPAKVALQGVIANGRPVDVECSTPGQLGTLWYSCRLGPVRRGSGEGGGEIVGAVCVARDITLRRQTETQLVLSDRLASVGTLAGGIAHEINNPLAAVMANLDLAARDLADLGGQKGLREIVESVRDAREAAERVRLIVRDLRIFSRSRAEEDEPGPLDVVGVLESTLRMAWNEIRHRARLVKEFGQVPAVVASEARVGQLFLNLIVNAAQSIREGNARGNEIRVTTGTDDKGRALITIADTGSGIPAEILPHVYTPFFSTKPLGVGSGLGLAICQRIVSELGGEIDFTTEVAKGTKFRVALRAAELAAWRRASSTTGPHAVVPRRGRILVVDDEPLVTLAVTRALGREHDVTAVDSGEKVLALLAEGGRFDVILCDLMMPQLTGMDLHAELALRAPDQAARMVFMSGGVFTTRGRDFLDAVHNPRIEKPFDSQGLRSLISKLLR
jgi:signal transduction histidine kinase/CheY-like chemotaxis protein